MNCEKAKLLIPLFVEADLDAGEMQQVTTHVVACDSCHEIVAEFQTSQSLMRAATLPEFDEAMMAAMRTAVRREIAQTVSRPTSADWLLPLWNWKAAFAAAAAVVLLLCGVVLSRRNTETRGIPIAAKTTESVVPSPRPETMQKTPLAQNVFQPRMGRKNKAQGGVSASERNPGNGTAYPPSPERATEIDAQIIAASIAPSGANDSFAKIPRIDTPDFTLPLALQAENATALMPHEKSVPEPEMLRMEIHTADPNIKIIWLTPKEPAATRTITVADTK